MTEKVCVFSASELLDTEKERIEKAFAAKHSGGVEFEYSIDSSLIGGVLVIDGNDYYDATFAGKLAKMKRNLQ